MVYETYMSAQEILDKVIYDYSVIEMTFEEFMEQYDLELYKEIDTNRAPIGGILI